MPSLHRDTQSEPKSGPLLTRWFVSSVQVFSPVSPSGQNDFSIPGRGHILFSVPWQKQKLDRIYKKKKVFFFYELGLGTFVGMSLKSQLRVWVDPSLIEKPGMCVWVCGFYCYSISSAAAAAVTCLWLTAVSHILEKKKKKKVCHI